MESSAILVPVVDPIWKAQEMTASKIMNESAEKKKSVGLTHLNKIGISASGVDHRFLLLPSVFSHFLYYMLLSLLWCNFILLPLFFFVIVMFYCNTSLSLYIFFYTYISFSISIISIISIMYQYYVSVLSVLSLLLAVSSHSLSLSGSEFIDI